MILLVSVMVIRLGVAVYTSKQATGPKGDELDHG